MRSTLVDRRSSAPLSFSAGHQHVDDLARGAVAEKLAEGLFVVGNAVAFHERDEIRLRVASQRRDAEARIARDEILRRGVDVGEIAASPARDADFLAGRARMVDHQHRASAPARLDGAHHPGRARADHHNVEILQGTPFRTVYRWLAKRRRPDKRSGERTFLLSVRRCVLRDGLRPPQHEAALTDPGRCPRVHRAGPA